MMISKFSLLFSFTLHMAFILALWNTPFFKVILQPSVIEIQLVSAPQKQEFIDTNLLKKPSYNRTRNLGSPSHSEKKVSLKSKSISSSAGGLVSDFAPLKTNSLPTYPLICRKRGHEGTVQCVVYINEKGHVTKVDLKKSSNSSLLDQVSLEALLTWRFLSPKENLIPSLSQKEITFHFRLISQDVTILSS